MIGNWNVVVSFLRMVVVDSCHVIMGMVVESLVVMKRMNVMNVRSKYNAVKRHGMNGERHPIIKSILKR